MQAEHLEVVADVADDRQLAGREHVVEPGGELRAADAAREEDDLHAAQERSSRARVRRAGADADALEVGGGVDVVAEVRQLEVVEHEPERGGVRPELRCAAGAVERLEDLRERKPERVRRPVRGGHDRHGAGASGDRERRQVGRAHPRQVRVDDEADAVDAGERSLDGGSLAAARVGDDLDAEAGRDRARPRRRR